MGNVGRPRKVVPVAPEPVAVNEAEGPVVIKLTIPRELYESYSRMAEDQEVTTADLMLSRLDRCLSHSSIRSLYFHTSHLTQLEKLLQKKPLATPEQALALLANSLSVRVGDFEPVPLTAAQVKRIAMNAYGGRTAEDFIHGVVQTAVLRAVGV